MWCIYILSVVRWFLIASIRTLGLMREAGGVNTSAEQQSLEDARKLFLHPWANYFTAVMLIHLVCVVGVRTY